MSRQSQRWDSRHDLWCQLRGRRSCRHGINSVTIVTSIQNFLFLLSFVLPTSNSKKQLISAIFLIISFSFICVVKLHCIFHCLIEWLKHLLWQKNKYFLWIPNKGCRRLNVIPFSNNQSECWRCCSNLLPNLVITVFERKIQILRLFLKP